MTKIGEDMKRRIGFRRLALPALLAVAVMPVSVPTSAAGQPTACRVRNVTEDTAGTSLKRMVEAAQDGDRLRVRGTCAGEIVIRIDVSIVGARDGATLTGRDRTRVLRIGGRATVSLRQIVVTRGFVPSRGGGAVLNRGRLTLTDSVVQDSEARDYRGGGVYNAGVLVIEDSLVRRNRSGYGGGGVFTGWEDDRARITGTRVTRNRTGLGGGGVENWGRLSIVDSVVRVNRADGDGGGINNAGRLRIVDSTVRANRSASGGGGIVAAGDGNPGSEVAIVRSRVSANSTSQSGGGILLGQTSLIVEDSIVSGNAAGRHGGGLYADGGAEPALVSLTGSVVAENSATRKGGGIAGWINSTIALTESLVTANGAKTGGGIFAWTGPDYAPSTVMLDTSSSVTGNTPDDCVGTPSC